MRGLLVGAALLSVLAPAALGEGIGGEWQGEYICAQGATGVRLAITPVDATHVRGVFSFSALAANPRVPNGCFSMDGVLEGQAVTLTHDQWLLQPWMYVFVDLAGTLNAAGDRITGYVTGPGCSTFDVQRRAIAPGTTPAACQALTS